MGKILLLSILVVAFATANLSADVPVGSAYVGFGTTGPIVGYRHFLSDTFAMRGDISGFSYNKDFGSGDVDYHGKLQMLNVGFYGDFFPFDSGFFLSTGAVSGKTQVKATAKPKGAGKIKLNGQEYVYSGDDFIEAKAKYNSFRPYAGIGYASKSAGWGFNANLGVIYGRANVTTRNSANLDKLPKFAENLEAERADVENKIGKYKAYPVLNFGVSYSF
jgi:hypothetical protein